MLKNSKEQSPLVCHNCHMKKDNCGVHKLGRKVKSIFNEPIFTDDSSTRRLHCLESIAKASFKHNMHPSMIIKT